MSDNTKAIPGALSDKCTCVYVDNGGGGPELLMYHCAQCHAAERIEALEADRDKARAEVDRLNGVLESRLTYHGLKGKCPCVDCSEIRAALEAKP